VAYLFVFSNDCSQQRDCSGLSPDSLFHHIVNQLQVQSYEINGTLANNNAIKALKKRNKGIKKAQ